MRPSKLTRRSDCNNTDEQYKIPRASAQILQASVSTLIVQVSNSTVWKRLDEEIWNRDVTVAQSMSKSRLVKSCVGTLSGAIALSESPLLWSCAGSAGASSSQVEFITAHRQIITQKHAPVFFTHKFKNELRIHSDTCRRDCLLKHRVHLGY